MGCGFASFGEFRVGWILRVLDRSDPLNRVCEKCVWHIGLCSVSEHVLKRNKEVSLLKSSCLRRMFVGCH